MYETFMNSVRRFFTPAGFFGFAGDTLGAGKMRLLVVLVFLTAVGGLVLWSSGVFRQGFRRWQERRGWRAVLAGVAAGLFKLLVLFILVRVLVVALGYHGQVFENRYGRITAKNRAAVASKWGLPHEQRELAVHFTRKRTWVTRQIKLPDEVGRDGQVLPGRILSDGFWEDDALPLQAIDGKMPTVISTRKEQRDVKVEQKSIQSADVEITLKNNPRELGGANYAGYEDTWEMVYTVANEQEMPVTAHMAYAPPADIGFFNEFRMAVDGKKMPPASDGRQKWDVPLGAGQEVRVEVAYKSRGLEHLRYIPRRMTPTAHYRVTMTVSGFDGKELDYPIDSMPATEKLQEMAGPEFALHWTLDNALMSTNIGLKLPVAAQPKWRFVRLFAEAPIGLYLLLALLVGPRIIMGRRVSAVVLTVMAAAYYLSLTFTARLGEAGLGFAAALIVSAIVLLGVVAFFRARGRSEVFLPAQDIAAFGLLVLLYPLAVIAEHAAFWMQIGYVALLFYFCALMAARCVESSRNNAAEGGQADPAKAA